MNLLKNNKRKDFYNTFKRLPKSSFVLEIPKKDKLSNLLFVSTIHFDSFTKILKRELLTKKLNYRVSEDTFILENDPHFKEIAFLNDSIYEARFQKAELFNIQARMTSWSSGPWIIEGFWADILDSHLLYGKRSLKKDKQRISKNCLSILIRYLETEIQNKQRLLKSQDLTIFEKKLLVEDLRIATIRKIFLEENILLHGFKDISLKQKYLTHKSRKLLEELTNYNNTEIFSF